MRIFLSNRMNWQFCCFAVENENHCDFVKLREMLIRTNMEDMRETTHSKHYELFRRNKLQEMGFSENESKRLGRTILICVIWLVDYRWSVNVIKVQERKPRLGHINSGYRVDCFLHCSRVEFIVLLHCNIECTNLWLCQKSMVYNCVEF